MRGKRYLALVSAFLISIATCIGLLAWSRRWHSILSERPSHFFVLLDDRGQPKLVDVAPRLDKNVSVDQPLLVGEKRVMSMDSEGRKRAVLLSQSIQEGRAQSILRVDLESAVYLSKYELNEHEVSPVSFGVLTKRDGFNALVISILIGVVCFIGLRLSIFK